MLRYQITLSKHQQMAQQSIKEFCSEEEAERWFLDTRLTLYDRSFWKVITTPEHRSKKYCKEFLFKELDFPDPDKMPGWLGSDPVPVLRVGCKNDEEAFRILRREVYEGVIWLQALPIKQQGLKQAVVE